MSRPSDPTPEKNTLRDQIIGLGAQSLRKSYYPQLQQQIAELEKAKASLEESERKFRALFEKITDGVVAVNQETLNIVMVNPAFCQMLGYTEAELLSLSPADIHPPGEVPAILEIIGSLGKEAPSYLFKELPFLRKDGSVVCTETNSSLMDIDGKRCLLGVCRDITERLLAERKLQRSEADLARAQSLAHLGSWSYDLVNDRLEWSDEIFRIMGLSPADFPATEASLLPFIHPDDLWKHQKTLQESLEGITPEPYDVRIIRPEGTERVIDIRGIQLETGEGGRPARIFGVAQDITERRAAEEALKREQEFNRALVESMVDAVIACDAKAELTLFNRAARKLHGAEMAKVPPAQWARHYRLYRADGVTPLPLDENALMRAYRGEVVHNTAMTIRPPELPLRHILINSAPFFDANGRMLGAVAVLQDITQRKNAEEALRKTEAYFHRFVEGIPVGYMRWKMDGSVVDANNQFLQMLGYSRKDLYAGRLNWITMTPGEFRQTDQQAMHSIQAIGRCFPFEKAFISKDGIAVPVLFSAVVVDESRQEGGAFVLDLTERKKAEEALIASEQKYRELVENANSIILRWTPEGTISYMNEYGLTFFGYTEEEIVGRRVAGTIVPEFESTGRSLFPLIHDVLTDPVHHQHNINENIRRNGERAWVAWTNKVVLDPAGRIKEILSIGSDVTERMRAEEELTQAKEEAEAANRAKDQFIAVLSHELRTPLTPVLSTISYLKLRDEIPEDFQGDLDMIRRNVELEARLIDDLLDVTRISRGILELQRENLNAHTLLLKVLEICRNEIAGKGMKIALNLDAEQFHVRGDSARLQQVFWNLLKNAIKFTPAEGRISIRTFNRGSRLRMEFADNGIGISPEILPKIFNAFEQGEKTWTRRFGGLGLGLSISKAIVDLHEGKLEAFSEGLNKGSVFTLELETVPPAVQEALPVPVRATRSTEQRKILLVEDHTDTLRVLARLLRRWNYNVQTAETVEKALKMADEERFDLLISDIGLPDGSGLEIMRRMRERYGTRGIALSGFGTEEDRKQSQEAGFELHLIKPVGVESLHAGVEQVFS